MKTKVWAVLGIERLTEGREERKDNGGRKADEDQVTRNPCFCPLLNCFLVRRHLLLIEICVVFFVLEVDFTLISPTLGVTQIGEQ